jgi:hypothetical protein
MSVPTVYCSGGQRWQPNLTGDSLREDPECYRPISETGLRMLRRKFMASRGWLRITSVCQLVARCDQRAGCRTAIYALAWPTCSVTTEGVMVSSPSARSTAAWKGAITRFNSTAPKSTPHPLRMGRVPGGICTSRWIAFATSCASGASREEKNSSKCLTKRSGGRLVRRTPRAARHPRGRGYWEAAATDKVPVPR